MKLYEVGLMDMAGENAKITIDRYAVWINLLGPGPMYPGLQSQFVQFLLQETM